jgi:hypothetical protein
MGEFVVALEGKADESFGTVAARYVGKAVRAMRRPIRSAASVRIWLILIQDSLGSPSALDSRVRGKPARGFLLVNGSGVEISPTNLAPQHSGHEASSESMPSSANAFSSSGSSFATSRASRVPANLSGFSAIAASIAWLRLGKEGA